MQLLGIPEAVHYCREFRARPGDAALSLREYRAGHLSAGRILREGTPTFEDFRACSLRDAERSLLLAASHYRRCLDLLIPSSSAWASVTAYYGAFHAAHAILALFGTTVFDKHVVDVRVSAPGRQELVVRKIGQDVDQEPTSYSGTHEKFWDIFYNSIPPLAAVVDPAQATVLSPISNNPAWPTQARNRLNYDTYFAIAAASDFDINFSASRFPASLTGELNTLYTLMEGLLVAGYTFANQLSLATDALSSLGPTGTIRTKAKHLVYGRRPPSLVTRTRKRAITSLGR